MNNNKEEKRIENEKKIESIGVDSPSKDDSAQEILEDAGQGEKQNRQVLWAIILMAGLILIILAVPYFMNNYVNKFDYHGIEFQKTMLGKIVFYSASIPVYSQKSIGAVTGAAIVGDSERKQVGEYAINFRTDPRKTDDIKIELDISNITFRKDRTVYATFNSSDPPCQHNVISAAILARYLLDFAQFDAEGAVMEQEYAKANKIPYITCENNPDNTVIRIVNGKENKISKVGNRCYELQYKECDILPVTEKFILIITEGYMKSVYNY